MQISTKGRYALRLMPLILSSSIIQENWSRSKIFLQGKIFQKNFFMIQVRHYSLGRIFTVRDGPMENFQDICIV